MRVNGRIFPATAAALTYNEYGEPSVSDGSRAEYGEAAECWVQTNTDDAAGEYEDGEFRRCAFTVLVDADSFTATSVRLERDGEELGKFRVMQTQRLQRMGRIMLMLRQ